MFKHFLPELLNLSFSEMLSPKITLILQLNEGSLSGYLFSQCEEDPIINFRL